MTPIEAYADVTVLEPYYPLDAMKDDTFLFAVKIPVGVGADVTVLSWNNGAGRLEVSADLAHVKELYDTELDWDPSRWMVGLDIGISGAEQFKPWLALEGSAGQGFRVAILAQPWWKDVLYGGVGAHANVDLLLGAGHTRALVGVRGDVGLVPGSATGALDAAREDIDWTWSPGGIIDPVVARASVHVGVALR